MSTSVCLAQQGCGAGAWIKHPITKGRYIKQYGAMWKQLYAYAQRQANSHRLVPDWTNHLFPAVEGPQDNTTFAFI